MGWQKQQRQFMYVRNVGTNLPNGMAVALSAVNGILFRKKCSQAPAKAPSASVPLGSVAPAGYNPNDIMKLEDVDSNDEVRYHTGISELDRVLGGGIVRGSLVLLGGDPGIGKSTLRFRFASILAKNKKFFMYRERKAAHR